jgi:rhodanese-related sulfurtransferase
MKKRVGKKNNLILVIAIIIVALGVGYLLNYYGNAPSEEELTYTDISVQEAKGFIDSNPNLIIIDVSPNYDEGHLPGAVNYYVGDGSLDDAIQVLDKNAEYLVYCHFESASRLGAEKLIKAGFENVYRLDGDYSAWVNADYPIEI